MGQSDLSQELLILLYNNQVHLIELRIKRTSIQSLSTKSVGTLTQRFQEFLSLSFCLLPPLSLSHTRTET